MSDRNSVGELPGLRQISITNDKERINTSNLGGQLNCADRFRRGMESLSNENWYPDFVISHSGWGCGLHVSWIFPGAKQIVYIEWWFSNTAEDYEFDPKNPWWEYTIDLRYKLRQRNLTLSLELAEADVLVAPTEWQRSQLPKCFQEACHVIHEGVDTDYFVMNPQWKSANRLHLTYATRGMEPMRGFPEFIEVLPTLLQKWPQLDVLLAGEDRVAYGANKPTEGTFGKWARSRLAPWLKHGRVKFLGHLSYKNYARLLKISDVHCYLTRPFVVSWSLLDAMASGCCIVASDVRPVREVVHPAATEWVDHRQQESLARGLNRVLALNKVDRNYRGNLQRERSKQSWSRQDSLSAWMDLLGI